METACGVGLKQVGLAAWVEKLETENYWLV